MSFDNLQLSLLNSSFKSMKQVKQDVSYTNFHEMEVGEKPTTIHI